MCLQKSAKLKRSRPVVTCCYGGLDRIYTGVATSFAVPVLEGSDLFYRWTVDGPSYTVVDATGDSAVIVFNQNASYVVGVTVWNNVSSVSAYVELVSRGVACFPPSVRLIGGNRFSELRSRNVRVETVVTTDCLDYRLQHDWSVWFGNCVDIDVNSSVSLPQLIVTDTPTLLLPARTLDYGAYCVKFRSCFYAAPGCNNVSVDVQIKESPLRALIGGGDERSVVVSEKIIFDGSSSYDPDVDRSASSFLTYNWTCQVVCSTVLCQYLCCICSTYLHWSRKYLSTHHFTFFLHSTLDDPSFNPLFCEIWPRDMVYFVTV